MLILDLGFDYEGSDHKPLLSMLEPNKKKRQGLFRYDRRLKDNEEVWELVRQIWEEGAAFSVQEKIEATRKAISAWNKTKQRNSRLTIEEKKVELEAALSDVANDTMLIKQISQDLKTAYQAEESYWKQRSRLLWLRLGDRNSGFFHAITRGRRRANMLSIIEDDQGRPVHKEEQIAQVIVAYFGNLFSSSATNSEETINYALDPVISTEDNDRLTQIPSAAEVKEAVFSIYADKAPGPDGFSAGFFHSNWNNIGDAITKEI